MEWYKIVTSTVMMMMMMRLLRLVWSGLCQPAASVAQDRGRVFGRLVARSCCKTPAVLSLNHTQHNNSCSSYVCPSVRSSPDHACLTVGYSVVYSRSDTGSCHHSEDRRSGLTPNCTPYVQQQQPQHHQQQTAAAFHSPPINQATFPSPLAMMMSCW